MNDPALLRWIFDQLTCTYGAPDVPTGEPVEMLVLTILSQNTTDTNRDRAFAALMDHFGTLERVAGAAVDDIETAIRPGGLQQQKAKSIKAALSRIRDERGVLDLGFLAHLALEDSMAWLLGIPGVGPKTAGIVLLFSFHRPVFPADTHIRRVMHRMGLVAKQGDPHPRLNTLLPPDVVLMQQLHMLAIRLGREICHPRAPLCPRCPLRAKCVWLRTNGPRGANEVTSAAAREESTDES